jgi:uncharacterized phiE125 gp8 family phage protein
MPLKLVTAPTVTPFHLTEAKEHLRVFTSDDDFYIQSLIDAVVSAAENITRRSLFTTTWDLVLDEFPYFEFLLPRAPAQSVTHIKYLDGNGDQQTIDASDYQVDVISEPARVIPAPSLSWPVTESGRINSVELRFVAGWAKRFDLPAGLRQAMFFHLSHLYDIREPVVVGTTVSAVPLTLEAMYAPYRVLRFF